MRTGSIYYLSDRTGEIRYVGKTVRSLRHRLWSHRHPSSVDTSHRANWIRANKDASIHLIVSLPETYLNEAEVYWISYFKSSGCRLVNGTLGGDGASKGNSPTPETRAKLSARMLGNSYGKGRKESTEVKARKSKSLLGHSTSPETRAKIAATLGGKPFQDGRGVVYYSIAAAAKEHGIGVATVHRALKGTCKKPNHTFSYLVPGRS